MWIDPIVKEVREAGEEIAKEAGYDVHRFFQNLREKGKKRNSKTVSRDNCQEAQDHDSQQEIAEAV